MTACLVKRVFISTNRLNKRGKVGMQNLGQEFAVTVRNKAITVYLISRHDFNCDVKSFTNPLT